jgi:serine/threonine protein phosphatase 1
LFAITAQAIEKTSQKLADLIATHGEAGFKKQATAFSYAALLFNANSGNLTLETLMQLLPTPDRWVQVMRDLEILAVNIRDN